MLHLDSTSVIIILLMGMTLIPKHVMTACQYKGDKDDTVLAVSFIRKSFSSKARGSAPVIKVSGCTHSEGEKESTPLSMHYVVDFCIVKHVWKHRKYTLVRLSW